QALTSQLEKDWLVTLAALKRKDPKIYQKEAQFYHETADDSQGRKERTKKDKPMYLKDYERKVILEKDGQLSDESDSDRVYNRERLGYYDQQEEIKKSISQALSDSDDSNEDFLQKKTKTKQEEEEEEEEYVEWLKGQKGKLKKEGEVGTELESLKNYWNNPKLDQGEKFLRDFFLNKGYKEKDEDDDEDTPFMDEGEGMSDEEEILEKQEQFERKYNFRYEEPDQDFIKSYPRVIDESVRQKPSKRSEKRKEIRDRKEKEKEKKKEELKQLKNLKKKEILRKIDQLKDISGNPEMGLSEGDLDEDFDPSKHDQMMQKYFSEEYYGMESEEQKPVFPDDLDDLQCDNWDEWTGEEVTGTDKGGEADLEEGTEEGEEGREEGEEWKEPHAEDPDFNMDDDFDPTTAVPKKKKKKKSKFAQVLASKKPVFNPDEKTFDEYLSEYYSLDYEDMIGDKPCRFKYRQVPANNYGLQVNEILTCREKELNAWVSLKKMVQHRTEEEEFQEARIYQNKAKNLDKKFKVLTSLKEEIDRKEKFEKKQEKKLEKKQQQDESDSENKDSDKKEKSGKKRKQKNSDSPSPKKIKASDNVVQETSDIHSPTRQESKNRNFKNPESGELKASVKSHHTENTKKRPEKPPHITQEQETRLDVKTNSPSKSQSTGGVSLKNSQMSKAEKRKEKRKKRKLKNKSGLSNQGGSSNGTQDKSDKANFAKQTRAPNKGGKSELTKHSTTPEAGKGKKKKKKGGLPKLSDERLLAYGINPKKLKYLKTDNYKGNKNS
ncbi:hypothetical protein FSP39_020586, partial [Pinctada imbricata]